MNQIIDFSAPEFRPLRPRHVTARYIVGGIVCIALGVVLFFVHLVVTLVLNSEPKHQAIVPGETEIFVTNPGSYTVFHEYRSIYNGKRYVGDPQARGLEAVFTHALSGETADLEPVERPDTYASRTGKGISLFRVMLDKQGPWRIKTWYSDEAPDQKETVLAIRKWNTARAPLLLLRSWGILIGPAAIGVFLILRGLLPRPLNNE